MKRMLFHCAIALTCLGIPGLGSAQTNNFNLRTVPTAPTAGQAFVVIADGNACNRLFVGDIEGVGQPYDQLTISPGVIRVQVGIAVDLLQPCDQVPSTVILPVPAQRAGNYQLELIGRLLFTTDTGVFQVANLTIGPPVELTTPRRIPASSFVSLGVLGLAMVSALVLRSPR